jgi:L-amino acid N-acyltransferase YncA
MTTIRIALPPDATVIAAIYNQGIEERSSTFETSLRTKYDMAKRIADARFPLLVAIGENDDVIGWAGLSSYRSRVCYKGVAEFSIYLDRAARGKGIGKSLLTALLAAAREQRFWKILSRVFPFNIASRALCSACGFREVGVYEKHSHLDGRWLDVLIVERLIPENMTLASPPLNDIDDQNSMR